MNEINELVKAWESLLEGECVQAGLAIYKIIQGKLTAWCGSEWIVANGDTLTVSNGPFLIVKDPSIQEPKAETFKLPDNAREVLRQLFIFGPTEDGNITSKNGRNELFSLQLAEYVNGISILTAKGIEFAVSLGLDREKEKWAKEVSEALHQFRNPPKPEPKKLTAAEAVKAWLNSKTIAVRYPDVGIHVSVFDEAWARRSHVEMYFDWAQRKGYPMYEVVEQ